MTINSLFGNIKKISMTLKTLSAVTDTKDKRHLIQRTESSFSFILVNNS